MKSARHRDAAAHRSEADDPLDPGGASASGAEPDARAPRAAAETAEAVAESGATRMPPADALPPAELFPFAPRTLPRAMARRAAQLGLQLPKPRLRGMLHLIAFPATVVIGLLLVALGETLQIRLACAVFVLTA